jgi:hypothetical protein
VPRAGLAEPAFFADFYRRVAVRYMFMAEGTRPRRNPSANRMSPKTARGAIASVRLAAARGARHSTRKPPRAIRLVL